MKPHNPSFQTHCLPSIPQTHQTPSCLWTFILAITCARILCFLIIACWVPSWHSVLDFTTTSLAQSFPANSLTWPASLSPCHQIPAICIAPAKASWLILYLLVLFFCNFCLLLLVYALPLEQFPAQRRVQLIFINTLMNDGLFLTWGSIIFPHSPHY